MANLFDRTNYPSQEPETLIVGDRWVWKREDLLSTYPSDTYGLTYKFSKDTGGTSGNTLSITATATSTAYVVEVSSTTTANLGDGTYLWQAYITRTSDSERETLTTGTVEVVPNFSAISSDLRSFAKKCVDNLEAVIQNRASIDQASFSIGTRSLSRMSPEELHIMYDKYKAIYERETKLARIKSGKKSGTTIGVRF